MSRATRAIVAVMSVLALGLLALSFVVAAPAQAQGSWTCTLDFTLGVPTGWTIKPSLPFTVTSNGLRVVSNGETYAQIDYTGTATTFTSVSMTVSANGATGERHVGTDPSPYYINQYNTWRSAGTNTFSASGFSASAMSFFYNPGNTTGYLVSAVLTGTGTSPCDGPTPTPTNTPAPTATATATPTPWSGDFYLGQVQSLTLSDSVFAEGWFKYNAIGRIVAFPNAESRVVGWVLWRTGGDSNGHVGFYGSAIGIGANGSTYSPAIAEPAGAVTLNAGELGSYLGNERVSAFFGVPASAAQTWAAANVPGGIGASLIAQGANADWIADGQPAVTYPYLGDNSPVASMYSWRPVFVGVPNPPTVYLTCNDAGSIDVVIGETVRFDATFTGEISQWTWEFNDAGENISSEADGHVEFAYYEEGEYFPKVTVTGPDGSDFDECLIHVIRPGDPGGGALYRPLTEQDQDTELYQDGLFSPASDWPQSLYLEEIDLTVNVPPYIWIESDTGQPSFGADDETVIAISKRVGDHVYAVADGTVTAIDPITAGHCDGIYSYSSTLACAIGLYVADSLGTGIRFAELQIQPAGVFRVQVTYLNGERIEYFVRNAMDYVREGQELLAGCIVGETMPFANYAQDMPQDLLEQYLNMESVDLEGRGITWLQRVIEQDGDTVQVPIIAQLYIYPEPGTACNAGGELSGCLFDPSFQNQGNYTWVEQGDVQWGSGVDLEPGTGISLTGLTLSSSKAYSFSVRASYDPVWNFGGSNTSRARVTLGIGTTSTEFLLPFASPSMHTIALAQHTPDAGALYSIRIFNSGSIPIHLHSNCVTDGDNAILPNTCYFQNANMQNGAAGWATSGTVISQVAHTRMASDLSTLGQNVRLYGENNGGHDYPLLVHGLLVATDPATRLTVNWRLGGGPWQQVASFTYAEQNAQITPIRREMRLTTTVTTTNIDSVFELQFDYEPAGADVVGSTTYFDVWLVCLDDSFSHHPPGTGPIYPPGTPISCASNPPPPANMQDDFGAWISYHLDGMTDIYYCEVIPQLEELNNVTYSIYEYAQWTGLYTQASADQTWRWVDRSLFPWLGGHLSNIALAGAGAVGVDVGGGCHDIFCLLDGVIKMAIGPIVDIVGRLVDTILNLLNTAVSVIRPLVEAIVGLFVQIINSIGSVLNWFVTLVTAFVTGITNAQPAPVPGLPNCALDPSSNGMCAVLYGLENTVFADEGAYIIPLFIALLTIIQLQWLISKVSELIQEVTDRI